MIESCHECGAEEYSQHKLSCDSKDVFNAYITLRDGTLRVLTDEMIGTLAFKLFVEDIERTQLRNEE